MANGIALPSLLKFLALRRQWLMIFMLMLLHLALALGVDNPWSRGFLISHLGVFLLWQPLWRGEDQLTSGGVVLIGVAALTVLFWLNWWMLVFWLAGLFALLGGKIFSFRAKWLRLFNLAGMTYLLAALLLLAVPHLFAPEALSAPNRAILAYFLPVLLVGMLTFPVEHEPPGSEQIVDFFYVLVLFMLTVLLVLGSFMVMTLRHQGYLLSLLQTIFLLAALLLALGWLWNPRFGFAGLQQVFSRYLLNIGTPFEQWVSKVADTAERERDAVGFVNKAARHLADLPWVEGVKWESAEGVGLLGNQRMRPIRLRAGQLNLELSTRHSAGPAMVLHIHLLAQIIGRFYEAKRREQTLRQITRLQAIYETGARLTHDVKNLLQSLYALASAAQQPGQDEKFQELLRRQLPQLTQRLELTLGKLQAPGAEQSGNFMGAAAWWEGVKGRYEGRRISFSAAFPAQVAVPAPLFDCVLDNLLDNGLKKRLVEHDIAINAALEAGERVTVRVWDTGSAVPEAVAARIFATTIRSETGLGIGLYQAAQWARQQGYSVSLICNRPGEVCFELAPAPPA
ncbi:MAG: HAMP domain-containing histidine kinase [Betaproteobacteria bacterium]|nr:HAMP domain-containing histidine kinase [Betaproteobacteria bacterium]